MEKFRQNNYTINSNIFQLLNYRFRFASFKALNDGGLMSAGLDNY